MIIFWPIGMGICFSGAIICASYMIRDIVNRPLGGCLLFAIGGIWILVGVEIAAIS